MQHAVDSSERLERIALHYFLFAALWIVSSDQVLGWLFPQAWKLGSILKGLLFVSVTALMLHVLIRRGLQRMQFYHRRTRAVLAAASDAILVLDGAGRIQESNAAALALFGLEPVGNTEKSVLELLPEGTPSTWQEIGQVEQAERELEMLRADGTVFPAIWRLRRALVGQDEVLVAFIEDLTARRALERQLVQAQKMESVGRLAAGVTHDLNNLLSVILGYAECLEDHLPPGHPGRRDMEGILKAAGGAALLSRRLLSFSRQPRFHQEVCDIGGLVLGLEGMLRGLLGENISLELRSPSEECLAAVDPNRLEQVVINLAVNSRDAMPGGGACWWRWRRGRWPLATWRPSRQSSRETSSRFGSWTPAKAWTRRPWTGSSTPSSPRSPPARGPAWGSRWSMARCSSPEAWSGSRANRGRAPISG